jgi:hypothetical protein
MECMIAKGFPHPTLLVKYSLSGSSYLEGIFLGPENVHVVVVTPSAGHPHKQLKWLLS